MARLLEHPRLPLWLALIGTLLTAPSLFIGLHLDDHIHRYLLSELPGAAELRDAYESPFGIANGEVASNQWQREQGYAPWWIDEDLLVSLYRPVSELSHRIDSALWPDNGLMMHAHSLLWFFALLFAVTRMYRALWGPTTVAGMAALLYAVDHTHGFAVGWVANRNAVIATCFGVLALWAHLHWRRHAELDGEQGRGRGGAIWGPALFAAALLSGEGSIAIVGYLIAYTVFVDKGHWRSRIAAIAPYLGVTVLWRVLYQSMGRGAHGSGLYIDPVREPIQFTMAAVERIPVLLLGQFGMPPAELHPFSPPEVGALIWGAGLLLALLLLVVAWPLVRRDGVAAFWGAGMLMALVPACSTHPNNRLLFFVGLGAMGLLSQLWHGLMQKADWLRADTSWQAVARFSITLIMGLHLVLAPLMLPFSACSILLTAPVQRAVDTLPVGPAVQDRTLVLVNAPDFFVPKLYLVQNALQGRQGPARLRVLSFGQAALQVERLDERGLRVRYHPSIMPTPLSSLYRKSTAALPALIQLEGLAIGPEGEDGQGARFVFDRDLSDPHHVWLHWNGDRFAPFDLPAVGAKSDLAPARVPLGM